MSLAAMVLADRSERLIRFYDRWVGLITFGGADRARERVLDEIKPGERLLDLGCGTGTLAVAAARRGAQVVAVDLSQAMLSLAQEKAAAAGVAVDWRVGDLCFIGLGSERFDVATATFVLSELSPELAALALRRLAGALRPGGRLLIADEVRPRRTALRLLTGLPRALLAILSFAALQRLAPTHRHDWRRLVAEAGLELESEGVTEAQGLMMLVATRPPELRTPPRPVLPLAGALPRRWTAALLRAAAWLDLPIAVRPGVYRIGEPGPDGPVLLTGNFLASVEAVRAGLGERDAYLIVEDTGGWNVWCAGDVGAFNASKAAALLELHELGPLVSKREVVLPRLGGRVRAGLAELTGWQAVVGPVEARDLPGFLEGGLTPEMRDLDRLYRLRERVRVGVLTLIQLPLFLLPLRLLPAGARRPAWRFAMAAGCILPLAHYRLPGRTGVLKAIFLASLATGLGLAGRRLRPGAAVVLVATAPLVGWVYQSSTPVIYWRRLWR